MSCNYAEGLSEYEDKGILGIDEKFDGEEEVERKCNRLADLIMQSHHIVLHTGAGISTSAGIPDFRGPNGVWTLEKKGLKPNINISFDDAVPTKTHMAIAKLLEAGRIRYIVSQNIDGLHLKSGIPRKYLAELHGNMFVEQCNTCNRQFVRNSATSSVGQKCLEIPCKVSRDSGRPCRGKLHDTILDWEHNLPEDDLTLSDWHSSIADLSICLGTTLQIVPSGNLPLNTKKNGGKLVIVNLQPTKYDRRADLIIHSYVDDVLSIVMKRLGLEISEYDRKSDPTKNTAEVIEWTISKHDFKYVENLYTLAMKNKPKQKARNKKRSVQLRKHNNDFKEVDINEILKKGKEEDEKNFKRFKFENDTKDVLLTSDDFKCKIENFDDKKTIDIKPNTTDIEIITLDSDSESEKS